MSEFIYVLENPSMPGLVKIGRTDRSVSERVNELSSATGVPTGFCVVKEYPVTDSVEAERKIHDRLSDYRVAENREFFKMEAEDATDIIESILGTATPAPRNFEREDELVARAIPIVVEQGTARPRMLEEMLGISYEEALSVIHILRGRGVIDERNVSKWKAAAYPPVIAAKANPVPPSVSPSAPAPAPPSVLPSTPPAISRSPRPIAVKSSRGFNSIIGVVLMCFAIPLLAALLSYDPRDVSANAVPANPSVHNWTGPFGAWLAYYWFYWAGAAAYLFPVLLFAVGLGFFLDALAYLRRRWAWSLVLVVCCMGLLDLYRGYFEKLHSNLNAEVGGILGRSLNQHFFGECFGTAGATIIFVMLCFISLHLLTNFRWVKWLPIWFGGKPSAAKAVVGTGPPTTADVVGMNSEVADKPAEAKPAEAEADALPAEEADAGEKLPEPKPEPEVGTSGLPVGPAAPSKPNPPRKPKPITVAASPMIGNYQLPPLDCLHRPDPTLSPTESKEELLAKARLIQQTLAQFDIPVELGDITKCPTITIYELHPAPGIAFQQVQELSSNLADALKTKRIILAPVQGKNTVGVVVPNRKVIMLDLLGSDEWRTTRGRILIALGQSIFGWPLIADMSEMPHLLIGGSTGAGKSVCLDDIIVSLLYRYSPDQLRFVMIDPNGIELHLYNALPHLVVPVVTDPQKAVLALRWVVNEMEKRFQIFMRVGVHNIGSFNSRPMNKPQPPRGPELPLLAKMENVEPGADGFAVEVGEEIVVPREEDMVIPYKLSYVVVIVETVEDLMQDAKADAELALEHLARNARATGIHLILTTRQASQNTLSESVKAEIPGRIAFRCESRIESRSIIGTAGAEKLLGKGDLLYLPPGSAKLIRAQSALVTEHEIMSVVEFIAKQAKPSYELEIHQQLSRTTNGSDDEGCIDEDEEVIQDCIEVIRSEQKASVNLLQRRLRLAYGRAARIMDELENRGIVGPSKGAEPRDILIDLDGGGVNGCPPQGVGYPIALEERHSEAAPDEQPPVTQPRLVVCLCQHCNGKIEFDANELGDRQSVSVPCPHCGIETSVSTPS